MEKEDTNGTDLSEFHIQRPNTNVLLKSYIFPGKGDNHQVKTAALHSVTFYHNAHGVGRRAQTRGSEQGWEKQLFFKLATIYSLRLFSSVAYTFDKHWLIWCVYSIPVLCQSCFFCPCFLLKKNAAISWNLADKHFACKLWKSLLLWSFSVSWSNYIEQQGRRAITRPQYPDYKWAAQGSRSKIKNQVGEQGRRTSLRHQNMPSWQGNHQNKLPFWSWSRIQQSKLPGSLYHQKLTENHWYEWYSSLTLLILPN